MLLTLLKKTTPKSAWNFLTKTHEVSKEDLKNYFGESVNVNFFKTAKFKKDEFKEDKNKLITFYNSKGYRDARIITDSIYDADANEINIDIKVEEGLVKVSVYGSGFKGYPYFSIHDVVVSFDEEENKFNIKIE